MWLFFTFSVHFPPYFFSGTGRSHGTKCIPFYKNMLEFKRESATIDAKTKLKHKDHGKDKKGSYIRKAGYTSRKNKD